MVVVYCAMILGVIGFQIALILGAPWGRITQGGQVEGALPRSGRVIAGVSIIVLIAMALAAMSAEGLWPRWPTWAGWCAVAVQGLSMVLNWITPSPAERRLWGPVTTVLFLLIVIVVWA